MQQDERERENYRNEIKFLDVECFVFLDEMSAQNRHFRRRRGRSKRGTPCCMREMARLLDSNTLIAACNLHGMIIEGCHVTSQNTTRKMFEDYIIYILGPHLSAYPGICSLSM